jgi:molybdopterin/thiamine biosynthesis adenylyltransferase
MQKKMQYPYNELFKRNREFFSKEEFKRLKNLKIAIAGAGGLGGPVAYNLARLGIKEIRLADHDFFSPVNISSQFGAYVDTIGKYKAEAIKKELLRINPYLTIKVWNTKVNISNIDEFLEGVDGVVDGIDFFHLDEANLLYREAKKRKLWVFTSQAAINIMSFIAFNPNSYITFEEMVSENGKLNLKKAIYTMFPILPKGATSEIIEKIVKKAEKCKEYHIPSYAVLPPIGGALVTEELLRVLVRKISPIAEAPNLFIFDLEKMKIFLFKNGKIQS